MLPAGRASAAHGGADGDRHLYLSAGHVAHLGSLVYDLVHDQCDEIPKHDLRDGVHAGHGRPDRQAHVTLLTERSIDDAIRAIFLEQPLGAAEYAAPGADIFAQHEDGLVTSHLLVQGFTDRLSKSQFTRRHVHLLR